MEFYGKIIAVTVQDLTRTDDGEAVMTQENYKKLVLRGRLMFCVRARVLARML